MKEGAYASSLASGARRDTNDEDETSTILAHDFSLQQAPLYQLRTFHSIVAKRHAISENYLFKEANLRTNPNSLVN